ncbi:Ribosomal-processing cysteine protease Prp, partial [Dysosmobacter welbionis]
AGRSLPSVEPPSACCHTLPSIFASIPRGPFGFHHKSVTVFSFGPGCDTLHIITPQQKGALMKRLFTILLAVLSLLSLTACGGSPTEETSQEPLVDIQPQEPEAPPEPTPEE